MTTPYICASCRRHLITSLKRSHLAQWQKRAYSDSPKDGTKDSGEPKNPTDQLKYRSSSERYPSLDRFSFFEDDVVERDFYKRHLANRRKSDRPYSNPDYFRDLEQIKSDEDDNTDPNIWDTIFSFGRIPLNNKSSKNVKSDTNKEETSSDHGKRASDHDKTSLDNTKNSSEHIKSQLSVPSTQATFTVPPGLDAISKPDLPLDPAPPPSAGNILIESAEVIDSTKPRADRNADASRVLEKNATQNQALSLTSSKTNTQPAPPPSGDAPIYGQIVSNTFEISKLQNQRSKTTKQSSTPSSRIDLKKPVPAEDLPSELKSEFSEAKKQNLEKQASVMKRIVKYWCEHGSESGIPEPLDALKTLYHHRKSKSQKLGQYEWTLWRESLWTLIAFKMRQFREHHSLLDSRSGDVVLNQINEFWDFLLRLRGECYLRKEGGTINLVHGDNLTWDICLASSKVAEGLEIPNQKLSQRIRLFLNMEDEYRAPGLESISLVSFLLLRQNTGTSTEGLTSMKPSGQAKSGFTSFMSKMLPNSTLQDSISTHRKLCEKATLKSGDFSTIIEDIERISDDCLTIPLQIENHVQDVKPQSGRQDSNQEQNLVYTCVKRIVRAIEEKNLARIERAHRDARRGFVTVGTGLIPDTVYAHLLTAYMAVRQPSKAMETLNEMISSGIRPTVAMWDAMLKGCGIAQDADLVQDIWKQMLDSRVQPDCRVWATRLRSLMNSGSAVEGFQAFQDMIQIWTTAVREKNKSSTFDAKTTLDEPNGVPKPNVQCVNVVLSGLARRRRFADLGETLKLAERLGIKLDVYSFNALFKSALRTDDLSTVMKLLQRMDALKIKPDFGTYSMIVRSLFRNELNDRNTSSLPFSPVPITDAKLPPGEGSLPALSSPSNNPRQAAIAQIFNYFASSLSFDRSDKQAALHIFHTFLTGFLLQSNPPNTTGASLTLSYLAKHNVPLTAAFYTILVTYNFRLSPPALATVQELHHHALSARDLVLDTVFFDRLIEGYTQHGRARDALETYEQAREWGRRCGWRALTELVGGLAREGDLRTARSVVDQVKTEEKSAEVNGGEIRYWAGRKEFWETTAVWKVGVEAE